MRIAIYVRVSTDEQTTENQTQTLLQIAKQNNWEVVQIYKDEGISGAKSRQYRPGFDKLLKDATRKKFDLIMAWSVDRLSRSLKDLIYFLEEIHALNVNLYLYQSGIDTTTPMGKTMFQLLGIFAEFERAIIAERVKDGLKRAKSQGKKLGKRPIHEEKRVMVTTLRQQNKSYSEIAHIAGVSRSTVQRFLKEGES